MKKVLNRPRRTIWLLILTVLGACSLYLSLLSPTEFGTYHDDAIYVTTAKTLATGQGYKIASLPYEPAQTKYPPLYPFLLSLIWRVYPQFPQNLTWMLLLSVLAAVSFLAMTYHYLTTQRYAAEWQALIVVGVAAINWRTIILATGIYSEMLYALLSVVALEWAENFEGKEKISTAGVILTLAMGLAFLTRSLGVTVIMAVGGYYTLKGKLKKAILAMGVAGAFVIGWMAWCYANRTSAEGINVAYYTNYLGHLNQVIHVLQEINQTSKLAVVSSMVIHNLIGGVILSVPVVCSGFNYGFFPSVKGPLAIVAILSIFSVLLLFGAGFVRHIANRLRLLHVYVITSLIVCLFWLPNVSYDRFLMPLLPFLLLFLIVEFDRLVKLARKEFVCGRSAMRKAGGAIVGLALLLLAGVALYNYGSGVRELFASSKTNSARANEDSQAIAWIKANADPSDILICYRDPKYFLFTGHKATRSFMTAGVSWQDDQASMKKLASLIFRIMGEAHGRYVVTTSTDFEFEDQPEQLRKSFNKLIEEHPEKFALAFESADGRSRIYRIENDTQ